MTYFYDLDCLKNIYNNKQCVIKSEKVQFEGHFLYPRLKSTVKVCFLINKKERANGVPKLACKHNKIFKKYPINYLLKIPK